MYIQHSLSYIVWNFCLNWLTFLEAMMAVLGVYFLSGHSVYMYGLVALNLTRRAIFVEIETVLQELPWNFTYDNFPMYIFSFRRQKKMMY